MKNKVIENGIKTDYINCIELVLVVCTKWNMDWSESAFVDLLGHRLETQPFQVWVK